MTHPKEPPGARVVHRVVSAADTLQANRRDWDRTADDYQCEHGAFLGDARFVWCPEGLDEAGVRLLGDVAARRVLEVGCGAGQCARWLSGQGAQVVGVDLSVRQLQHSRRLDAATGLGFPWSVQPRPGCRWPIEASTSPARHSARCRSWPTPAT